MGLDTVEFNGSDSFSPVEAYGTYQYDRRFPAIIWHYSWIWCGVLLYWKKKKRIPSSTSTTKLALPYRYPTVPVPVERVLWEP